MTDDSHIIPRIIAHMNKDHVHNLEDYLVVYSHVDSEIAKRNPTLETLSLSSMTISYIDMHGTKCFIRIPFEPTLQSYRDSRNKLVEMAQKAAAKRGFSEYLINDIPFKFKDWITVLLFISLYIFAYDPSILQYLIGDQLLNLSSNIQSYIMDYHITVFRTILIIHCLEAIVILYPLLRKFRMSTLKKMTCLLLCMMEGMVFLSSFKVAVDEAQNPKKPKN